MPGPVGTIMKPMGGPGTMGMWSPIGGLTAGAVSSHRHHLRRRAHHWHQGKTSHVHWASRQGKEDPEDLGRADHGLCRRRSREWSCRPLSLLKCSSCVIDQALGLLSRGFLVGTGLSQSLCVCYQCSVSFSQMENRG